MNQKYILSANNNSLIEEIHNTVQSIGYCIVRGLNLNHLDGSRRNKKLFDFLSQ
ncbi:TPA: taurine catabolism dioxygenase TauD, partial [Neisseria meningitidis]